MQCDIERLEKLEAREARGEYDSQGYIERLEARGDYDSQCDIERLERLEAKG